METTLKTQPKRILTRREAAEYLAAAGIPSSLSTLQKKASTGGGPIFRVVGRNALYKVNDLDAWIDDQVGGQ
jgi:hypothetical protein